jgi:N-ethylmaleimide reductase
VTSLFDPITIAGKHLANRIVMAPMSRIRSDDRGLATDSMASYYRQRAGAGLIVTEGIHPSAVGQSNPRTPGLHTTEQIASWRTVTSAVHGAGGHIFAQIMHAGRISHPDTTGRTPVAPSPIAAREVTVFTPSGPQAAPIPRELSTSEVHAVVEEHAAAARGAIVAGFDGVELHGANGYLIAQFLSSNANLRSDGYGRTIEGRIRFATEAVSAAAGAIGAERVGLRLSPGAGLGDAHDDDILGVYSSLLTALAPLDLAYVHLTEAAPESALLALRRAWPGRLIVNPSTFGAPRPAGRSDAERWLAHGADMIAFGRAFIANPDLVERLRLGWPVHEADPATFYVGGDDGYLTYHSYNRHEQVG